jgi:hypothetical protein
MLIRYRTQRRVTSKRKYEDIGRRSAEFRRVGKQSFAVTELTTTEPDPKFFAVPQGYKVVDRRRAEESSN